MAEWQVAGQYNDFLCFGSKTWIIGTIIQDPEFLLARRNEALKL